MSTVLHEDMILLSSAAISAELGVASVFSDCHALSWIAIVTADLYLFCVLFFAARRTDHKDYLKKHHWVKCLFPRRTAGLFLFALLMLAIVSGFAGLYVGTNVFQSSKTPLDGFYISLITMGFNDPSPTLEYGKSVVIFQFVSGVLLLVGVFPLLISRISTFKST